MLRFLDAALHHWRTSRQLRRRRVTHRTTDVTAVERAYSSMSSREFRAVNGLQAWANRRAIPRILAHIGKAKAWACVDLGCGSGDSTQVLLRHAPPGSHCIGYDVCGDRLAEARTRNYRGPGGRPSRVSFVRQPIDTTLRDPMGEPLPDRSIDLVHSSGVVGHHMQPDELEHLGHELRRIIHPTGTVILDAGPELRRPVLVDTILQCGLQPERVVRYCWANSRCLVAFRPL